MTKVKKYAAHFKPLVLPAMHNNQTAVVEMNVQPMLPPRAPTTIYFNQTATEPLQADFSIAQAHQQFIQQQTQLYQYFIQQQCQLWQSLMLTSASQPIAAALPGPKFSREVLEQLASNNISDHFGEWFKPLDHYERLIRMPEPPLLLADRVTGIDAQPGSLQRGTIWTETDVTENAWYLHHGRMPAGIMIEAGQADLLLASWLGFDLHNRGERIYRLLGCELTYYGGLPQPGDTLCYDIHIDGQAQQGETRLFFFHYDCRINGELRLQVRNGQAGFFSDEELDNSGGVLWDAAATDNVENQQVDKPLIACQYHQFTKSQLEAFAHGDTLACFGAGFELAAAHTRTPHISSANMLLLDEITDFDSRGGPQQRGYLRAIQNIHADDWFFKGHFKNDPCMPGTLMLEAGLQAMSCYLTALGYTLNCDGWRFEPVAEHNYKFRCRGQVRPHSKQVVYEIFVVSVVAAPQPTIFADLLATVDGLKAFHTQIGLRLTPDWLLTAQPSLPNAETKSFNFDYASLLACAWGKPSAAFGETFAAYDNHHRIPRLPGPPYHFMSRVKQIKSAIGSFKTDSAVEVEYDIPADAWYFAKNSQQEMPFCVLLESALQPCGWLAMYIGSILNADQELLFRNLDGTATVSAAVMPTAGKLRTKVQCTNISQSAGMILESFQVESFINTQFICKMHTTFGFFPKTAFENQAGLPIPEHEQTALQDTSDFSIDLTTRPAAYCAGKIHLPDAMLLMFDRVTGFWPDKGSKGLGRLRAEKTIDPYEWFFKAHFFQDPVQPGSLGIETMIQLLQFYMLQQNMQQDISNPSFQSLALHSALTWKYRGQVVPTNKKIITILDIVAKGADKEGVFVYADASLWVDGKRIYEAKNLGMRIVEQVIEKTSPLLPIQHLDPAKDRWLWDHCPNYILPTLPLMNMVDYLVNAASQQFPDKKVVAMKNIQVLRWVVVTTPLTVYAKVDVQDENNLNIILYADENNQRTAFVKANLQVAEDYAKPSAFMPAELHNQRLIAHPYERLFHGSAFQAIKTLQMGENGSTAILNAAMTDVPFGCWNPALLDGATHGIPHDHLELWHGEILPHHVGYPNLILNLICSADAPHTGDVQCETRFAGFHHNNIRFPKFAITLLVQDKIWLQMELVEVLLPKGNLGKADANARKIFLGDKQYVPELSLSNYDANGSLLTLSSVKEVNWIAGSVEKLYGVAGDLTAITKQIVIKEHIARQLKVHPADIIVENDQIAYHRLAPEKTYAFVLQQNADAYVVTD